MRSFKEVFKYTLNKYVCSSTYIITTCVISFIIIIAMIGMKFAGDDSNLKRIGILDKTGIFSQSILTLDEYLQNSKVEILDEDTEENYKEKVLNEEDYSIVILESNHDSLSMKVLDNNSVDRSDLQIIQFAFEKQYKIYLGEMINLNSEQIQAISKDITCEIEQVDTTFEDTYIITYIMLIFIVIAIIMYGSNVAGEITYAKTNRVMELLITSVSASALFLGITLSIGLAGILQLAIILVASFVGYQIIQPSIITIDSINIDFSIITLDKVIVYILFFILGYFIYAVMNAGIGSLVSKNEDIVIAIMPTQILATLQLFTGLYAIISNGKLITFLSYFPLTSAGTMMTRYITGKVSISEVTLSIVILFVSLVIVAYIAIKLFKVGILYYGNLKEVKFIKER